MRLCTIVARNYLDRARVLAESIHRCWPGTPLDVLVIDALPDEPIVAGAGAWTTVRLGDLDLDPADVRQRCGYYDVTELATSLKPALLRRTQRAGGIAAYLDPDTVLFAPLDDIEVLLHGSWLLVTPHVVDPMPRDGLLVDEATLLISGMYNLGFIAIGPSAGPFLDWWDERLRFDAINDPVSGRFTDQRWIDFAPSLFPVRIVRDKGWNVAYWNLHERPLARDADGALTAGGQPIRFFHFSGFDPASPHAVSCYLGDRPRITRSTDPLLASLLDDYVERLAANADADSASYRWDRAGAVPLTPVVRRLYRDALLSGDRELPAGGPFADPDAFHRWVHQAEAMTGDRVLRRLHLACWRARSDLQAHFPYPLGRSLVDLANWFEHHADEHARTMTGGATGLTRLDRTPAGEARPCAPALVIAGYLRAELGVGEAGRLVVNAARHTGLPVTTVTYDRTVARQTHRFRSADTDAGDRPEADLVVMCVNADETPGFVARAEHRLPAAARRAGLWFWEVPALPEALHGAFDALDEVWAPSKFVADTLELVSPRPVRVLPLPIVADPPTRVTRADLGIPDDRYVFGFAADAHSVLARKNPIGLLDAYVAAFDEHDGAHLVVKLMNGHIGGRVLERLRWSAGGRADITVVDQVWSPDAARALYQVIDCYASLHRSEGFGLGLAQSMAQGLPVIATGWSGNLEFMDATNSFLVPYELVPVGYAPPYPADTWWADPDHDAAVDLLRHVFVHPGQAEAVGARARQDLARRFSIDVTAEWLRDQVVDASTVMARRWAAHRTAARTLATVAR